MKHLTNGIFLFLIIIIVPRFPELAYSVDFDKIPTGEVDKLINNKEKVSYVLYFIMLHFIFVIFLVGIQSGELKSSEF